MSIIGGALIGGAANLVGSLFGNNSAKKESSRNREFQERMAKNAHQYEVSDLKAAGLNPLLSAGGSGASTPSGSQANINTPKLDLTQYANSAADTKNKSTQNELLEAQINNVNAQTTNTEALTTATNLENAINTHSKGMKEDIWSKGHDIFKWGNEKANQGIEFVKDAYNENSAKTEQSPKRMHIKSKKMQNGASAVPTPQGYYIDAKGNKYNKHGKLIK